MQATLREFGQLSRRPALSTLLRPRYRKRIRGGDTVRWFRYGFRYDLAGPFGDSRDALDDPVAGPLDQRMATAAVPLGGGSHSGAVRVGQTVRRLGGPWSPAVLDLLRHLEAAGLEGAPRAQGFDEVLVQLGALVRATHDAASTFPWAGRHWQVDVREPVETVCHNDLSPGNVVFRAGLPVVLIDWEAAAPGPRAWDLGYAAWRWVPFWSEDRCRAAGLPTDIADKARRLRLLLDGYGAEPDVGIVRTAIARMRQYLDHWRELVAEGSEWETALARRGVLDELARETAWVEERTEALVES